MLISQPRDGIMHVVNFFRQFHFGTHLFTCSKCFPQCQPSNLTAHSPLSALPQSYLPPCSNLEWLAQLEKLTLVMMAEKLKYIVEEKEVHTMEVLASMKDLGGFSS